MSDLTEHCIINKKDLVKQILELSRNEHIELFRLINNHTTKYTINNNGIFINMNVIDDLLLNKINNFLEFCVANTESLDKHESYINNEKIKFLNSDDINF
jgi:hypothetical protein